MFLYRRGVLSRLLFSACLVCALSACSLFDDTEVARGGTAAPPAVKKPPMGVVAPVPSPMETLRSLLPPEGLRFMPLFNEKMSDTDDRFRRLEGTVQDMRNDLDTVVPALARMAIIDRDNKAIEVQQQTLASMAPPAALMPSAAEASSAPVSLVQSPPMTASTTQAPPQAAPEVAKTAEATPVLPPPTRGDVKDLRMADHKDMTRIVLDMTAEYNGAVQLDSNGKRLVISLQKLNWLGQKSVEVNSAELVSGYHVADGNLYIDLMYPAQIKEQKILLPSADSKNYRAVIDLYSSDVHKK